MERGDLKKKVNIKDAYMSLSEIQSNLSFVLLFNALTLVLVLDQGMYPKLNI